MSRSLAIVGILTITGAGFIMPAHGQSKNDAATTTPVATPAHMSDDERDRLMKEAMEKARKQLDDQKAAKARNEAKALDEARKKEESRAASEKLARDKKADEDRQARDKKAEEERLAKELAEKEKSTPADNSVNELKSLTAKNPPVNLDDVKKAETTSKPEDGDKKTASAEPAKKTVTVTTDKKLVVTGKKTDDGKKSEEPTETVKAAEKTSEGSTDQDAGSKGISKLSAARGGAVTDAERNVNFHEAGSRPTAPDAPRESSDGVTVSGSVVGLMRTSTGAPRILVRDERGLMNQVILEDEDLEIPAAGATVVVKGRGVGEGPGGRVISSRSVSIKSGGTMERVAPGPMPGPMMGPAGPMMPPMGMMPPPMVIGGPMMHGYPPF